jgi:glycerol-3-phosphate acyltransferase PlsX
MISGILKEEFKRNIFTKIAAIIAYPVLSALMKRVDHRRYNGAALAGSARAGLQKPWLG